MGNRGFGCTSHGWRSIRLKPKPIANQTDIMKSQLKAALVTLLSLSMASSSFCDESSGKMKAMTMDHVMMKDGKMMVMMDGKSMMMDKEMTMKNGNKVMKDGTVMMKDGSKMMMKDGEMMSMEGMMMKNHVMMKDGKMMVMMDGKMMMMEKDMTLENGSKVMMDGTVMMKDGAKMMMKDGEMMGMDGMKMTAK
jgi:uncharacterized Zn ribbon protein